MSEARTFRTKAIMVSPFVFSALKALADVQGMDCPDALADSMLGKWLQKEHQLDWLIAESRKEREALAHRYRLRCQNSTDSIPGLP